MKIDVTIAAKNSAGTIGRCLEAIRKHLPYNRILVIDDSEDETPRIAADLGAEVHRAAVRLGRKRALQAELAETEWIASIDSDIFVYENWWPTLSANLGPDVAGTTGYLDSLFRDTFPAYEAYTKFIASQRFKRRGHGGAIGNTLIRREVLLGVKDELAHVHAGEDHVIGAFCARGGWRWVPTSTIIGMHYHEDSDQHHRMAYYRAGRSTVINNGRVYALKPFCGQPVKMFHNWLRYSLASRRCDPRLFRWLAELHGLTMRGIADESFSRPERFSRPG